MKATPGRAELAVRRNSVVSRTKTLMLERSIYSTSEDWLARKVL
jgi:hypothetical protein